MKDSENASRCRRITFRPNTGSVIRATYYLAGNKYDRWCSNQKIGDA